MSVQASVLMQTSVGKAAAAVQATREIEGSTRTATRSVVNL